MFSEEKQGVKNGMMALILEMLQAFITPGLSALLSETAESINPTGRIQVQMDL